MFTKFDRANLKNLRADLQAVLDAYAAKNGLEFELGGIRFSDAEATIKVTTKIKGALTRTDAALALEVQRLGLVMEKNGKRLVRYDAKKYKFPFIYDVGGKLYKTTELGAKALFAA
jgi:hypothetical protein